MKIRGQVIKPQKMEKVGQSLTVSLRLLLLPAQSTASQSPGCTQSNHSSVLMITTLVAGDKIGKSLLIEDGVLDWIIANPPAYSSSTRRHIELALCHLAQNGMYSTMALLHNYRKLEVMCNFPIVYATLEE